MNNRPERGGFKPPETGDLEKAEDLTKKYTEGKSGFGKGEGMRGNRRDNQEYIVAQQARQVRERELAQQASERARVLAESDRNWREKHGIGDENASRLSPPRRPRAGETRKVA